MDLDNGQGLEFSAITIKELNKTSYTNERGGFEFKNICEGNYTIIIQHLGCKDSVIYIKLLKPLRLTIKLPHSAIELSSIDIMDKRVDALSTQTVSKLEGSELDKTKGQSLGDALKTISGVTTLNTGSTISKPMIHGLQGYRILLLNNGIRHEGQQWGNEHAPEIDPFIGQKISVIKGANSIRYGSDAIAGVIMVEPNDLPDTASVTGELNLIGISNGRTGVTSGILQGYFDKLKNINWRVQGTLKKGGAIKTPDYYLKNTGLQEYNFSYALGYHKKKWGVETYYSQFNTKIGIFSGAHIGNLSDLKLAFEQNKPQDSSATFSYSIDRPFQDITHELIKGKVHYHFAPRWRLSTQYAWQHNIRKEYDKHPPLNDSLAALNLPELDYRITSQTVDVLLEHDNIRSFRGQAGVNYLHQSNVYLGRFFIPNFINNTWGTFITERFVRQRFEIEAGVRYDQKQLQSYFYENKQLQSPHLQFNNFTWTLGSIWKPDSTLNFFLNLGSAWRAPAPNELYSNGVHHGVGAIERGDKTLGVETVNNITLTGIIKKSCFTTELTLYYNQFNNFIYLNPSTNAELTIKGAYPVFNYKQANVRINGIDLNSKFYLNKHFTFITKAAWLRAWNYTIHDYLVYMPSDRYEAQINYAFKSNDLFSNNSIQVNCNYITKQWRVPANTDFAPPPNGYMLMGIDVSSTLLLKKQPIVISCSVNNLLNKTYRDYLDRFRYYADAQGQSFTLRLKVPLILFDKQ